MLLICLFGPDGSGKSTLARYLLEELKKVKERLKKWRRIKVE